MQLELRAGQNARQRAGHFRQGQTLGFVIGKLFPGSYRLVGMFACGHVG
jgi:hypothetical protein